MALRKDIKTLSEIVEPIYRRAKLSDMYTFRYDIFLGFTFEEFEKMHDDVPSDKLHALHLGLVGANID